MTLFGKPIENVNAVGYADADDQRQGHDIRGIEFDANNEHEANHPKKSHTNRNQGQYYTQQVSEMPQHQNDNRNQGIYRRFFVTILEQFGIKVELHRRASEIGR